MADKENQENDTFLYNGNYTSKLVDMDNYPIDIEEYLVPFTLALICIVGLLGNCSILFVMRKPNQRKAPNNLIFNLALADLLGIISTLPIATKACDLHWCWNYLPYPATVCHLTDFFNTLAIGVSAITLTALSVYSFVDARDATRRLQRECSTRYNGFVVVIIWALATVLAFSITKFLFTELFYPKTEHFTQFSCQRFEPRHNVLIRFLVFYAIPLVVVSRIQFVVHHTRNKNYRHVHTHNVESQAQSEFEILANVLFAIYALCFYPKYVFMLLHRSDVIQLNQFWYTFGNDLCYCVGLTHRCLNPVALYYSSGNFRQLFKRQLLCWFLLENREPVSHVSAIRDPVPHAARNRRQEKDALCYLVPETGVDVPGQHCGRRASC